MKKESILELHRNEIELAHIRLLAAIFGTSQQAIICAIEEKNMPLKSDN